MPEAYERLLLDVMHGDASLFSRADEVELAWGIIDPIQPAWDKGQADSGNLRAQSVGPRQRGHVDGAARPAVVRHLPGVDVGRVAVIPKTPRLGSAFLSGPK